MGTVLEIRDDLSPCELRRWARREARGRPAARAYAISNALEGTSRLRMIETAGNGAYRWRSECPFVAKNAGTEVAGI